MLETRMPSASPMNLSASPLPRRADGTGRPAPSSPYARYAREAAAREGQARDSEERARPPARTAAHRNGRNRMARSEGRLLTFAVAATTLMCAVLVIYLAAYAHVSQLGLDQARARVALRQARLDNDILQAKLARLQSPSRIAAAAHGLGMTADTRPATYLSAQDTAAQTADDGDTQNIQVANGGTSADGNATATFGH